MNNILMFGAGKSASSLIQYFIDNDNYKLIIIDKNIEHLQQRYDNINCIKLLQSDISDKKVIDELIGNCDIVISMLPASLHIEIIKSCIKLKKNIITPSYISNEIKELKEEIEKSGIMVLCELGLDPGIDHMSAKKIIDRLHEEGNQIIDFESFTGGLVSPEFENNPWNYKFTWNPRNVVLAGQGTAMFLDNEQYKYIPYHKLFRRTEIFEIGDLGIFEGYANRDSLKYREAYNLQEVKTMYRGTLRRLGFCRAWDIFVQLGMTDDTYRIPNSYRMTYRTFTNLFLKYHPTDSVEIKLRYYLGIAQDDILWDKIMYLELFSNEKYIEIHNGTPAEILQSLLEEKFRLERDEKDMILMYHKIIYKNTENELKTINSYMVSYGINNTFTAMSNTVGLPIAIATKLILNGSINPVGLKIPVEKDIYLPILEELEEYNIIFHESADVRVITN